MAVAVYAIANTRSIFNSLFQKHKVTLPVTYSILRNNYSSIASNEKCYDIVITGGGMVGTTLACALANNRQLQSRKILLLEGGKKQTYEVREKYSNRVVALNQQTRTLLSSIGAWQHIEAVRYAPVKKMQVWDACSDAMITFNEDHLADELAYIVENDLVLHAVNKQLAEKESVSVEYNSKVEDISLPARQGEDAVITLQDGQQFRTKLLIGADGVHSLVRKTMGVQYLNWNYNQMGIVATVQLSEPTENIIGWQRFLPSGPVALLPLTDTLSSLVWSMTSSRAKELLALPEEEFLDALNDALWKVYPKDGIVEAGMSTLRQLLEGLALHSGVTRQLQPSIKGIVEGTRAGFPLGFGHAASYVQPGAVLIGDAAHRVHPLAGQGVNLGFGDITVLVQILAKAARNGAILGDTIHLSEYETLRQRHNVPTMLVIDALHRLYKGTAAPIVLARSLGLQLTNALPPLKRTSAQLRKYFSNIKQLQRDALTKEKQSTMRTGGGPPDAPAKIDPTVANLVPNLLMPVKSMFSSNMTEDSIEIKRSQAFKGIFDSLMHDLDLDNSNDFSGMNDTVSKKKDSESITFTESDLLNAPIDILPSITPSINCTSIAAVTWTISFPLSSMMTGSISTLPTCTITSASLNQCVSSPINTRQPNKRPRGAHRFEVDEETTRKLERLQCLMDGEKELIELKKKHESELHALIMEGTKSKLESENRAAKAAAALNELLLRKEMDKILS